MFQRLKIAFAQVKAGNTSEIVLKRNYKYTLFNYCIKQNKSQYINIYIYIIYIYIYNMHTVYIYIIQNGGYYFHEVRKQ